MPSIKKSELEQLKLRANSSDCYLELLQDVEARLRERNKTVGKLLHNGINLAAELRDTKTLLDGTFQALANAHEDARYSLAARDSEISNLYKRVRTLDYELARARQARERLAKRILEQDEQIHSLSEPRGWWARLSAKFQNPNQN